MNYFCFMFVSLQTMAAPVIICIAIAASGTTLCTVQNVPESHLNHPECEQDWSTVPVVVLLV